MSGIREALTCQKSRFSLPAALHYLNCAYMAPLSKRVQDAGVAGVRKQAVPTTIQSADFFTGCDEVRGLFARLVGLQEPARVAIIPAASYGLATAALNTVVERGQNVVTVHEQFPSNVHVWRRVCANAGANVRTVQPPVTGATRTELWNEAILSAIDGDTAAVALGPIHWTDGTRFDLERIGERARKVGAAFVVDGTQSVGAEPFDIERIQPDALVCAGYKWLTAPYSIGTAYYGPRYDAGMPLEETWIGRAGSDDLAGLVSQGDAYRAGAARYDVGETANFVLLPMLIAALEQLLEWGTPDIAKYIASLTRTLFKDARLEALGISAEPPDTAHLFGLRLPSKTDPKMVEAQLRELGVHVSVRGRLVRVSPHVYNDTEDAEALLEALEVALDAG